METERTNISNMVFMICQFFSNCLSEVGNGLSMSLRKTELTCLHRRYLSVPTPYPASRSCSGDEMGNHNIRPLAWVFIFMLIYSLTLRPLDDPVVA